MGLGLLIYGQSLTNGFCQDDKFYVYENPSIASLSGLAKMWSFQAIPYYDNPVTLTFFWLGHKLWGFNPWGYHCINLAFHILNGLLLYGLVRRLKPVLAGITALLFTIHPIQVETVASISELKNILCLFFFFLAFHSFLNFENDGRKRTRLKMLLFFTASILSKFTGVCFAAVPLLYSWYKSGKFPKRTILLMLPVFFLGALSVLIPIHLQNTAPIDTSMTLFPSNLILSGKLFFFYIKQILLPWKFMSFYPRWDISAFQLTNWIYPAGILATYAVFYYKRHSWGRGAFTLLCFYGISICPALGFFKISLFEVTYAADHFTYLSIFPLLFLSCNAGHFSLLKLQTFLFRKSWAPSFFLKRCISIILISNLALSSYLLTLNYKDQQTLALRFMESDPKSPLAYYFVGAEILRVEPEKAIPFFQRAILLKPYPALRSSLYYLLGLAYLSSGKTENAVQTFQKGVLLSPENENLKIGLEAAQAALAKMKSKN